MNDTFNIFDSEYSITQNVTSGILRMFYIINPAKSSYENVADVPNVFRQALPYFFALILLENIILWLKGKPMIRLNDGITSFSHGIFLESSKLLFRGSEHFLYVYIHEHFRATDLAWDSPSTWYLAALGVDFCYYWVHRASHEVHLLWAQHQVHHSSEEFNLAVGLRQSFLHGWCGFLFYLPLAVVIPPSQFLVHQQFNLLYQFWIHTTVVETVGPLEWVFNTPNHHRVHHGCNLYCLDKNYGGFLIIWDRLFGTFAKERKEEEIIYGLVYNQPSFNPFYLQVFYNANIVDKWKAVEGWQNKLAAIWKGPSWMPGQSRTGDEHLKLNIISREKYDVELPVWCNVYLLLHFTVVVYGFQELCSQYSGMSPVTSLGFMLYVLASLTTIGMLFDDRPYACLFELARCLTFLLYVQRSIIDGKIITALQIFFFFSTMFWLLKSLNVLRIQIRMTKKNKSD